MDVFLLASGFFAGYKMSKDLEVRFRIPWIRRIVGRFIRFRIFSKLFLGSVNEKFIIIVCLHILLSVCVQGLKYKSYAIC